MNLSRQYFMVRGGSLKLLPQPDTPPMEIELPHRPAVVSIEPDFIHHARMNNIAITSGKVSTHLDISEKQ
jgi:hypothetical protein